LDQTILTHMINKYPDLQNCVAEIEQAYALLSQCYRNGGKLLLCGNGGSASDCEHITGELMKGFNSKRPLNTEWKEKFASLFEDGTKMANQLQGALPAISLVSQTALMSAVANDIDAEMVFAQQVFGYGRSGDVLIGLSTSGNSANVIQAIKVAKALGMGTIGLTGASGGRILQFADVTIRVPWVHTPDVQERHLPIYHALCLGLEKEFFP
jgi:phosphoheptose isomerase